VNPYLSSLPTVVLGLVVLFFLVRIIRLAGRMEAESKAGHERRKAELDALQAKYEAALAARAATPPADLLLELDLRSGDVIPGLRLASEQTEPLVSALSRQEQELGGAGLTLTEARVEPGAIRLTLSPIDRAGSAERVRRVADQVNAAGAPLPPGVTAARADVTAV
jgi:hypothetical protein